MRFDEQFIGGFEDTDFCKQMEMAYPNKHTVINENCRLVHLNEKKRQENMGNARKLFVEKWGWVHHPKKMSKTIIYYTHNLENENFENKIRENILRVKGNLPIISVSQKPIDFGKNICIGKQGDSYLNAFRQLLIGCKEAKTEYVVMAESDCLYPEKGYFDFEPKDPNKVYSYDNVWIMNLIKNWQNFHHKKQTHGSMIYGREWLIKFLEERMKGQPEWSKTKRGIPFYNPDQKFEHFTGDPIINIITGVNGRKGTTTTGAMTSLPYWGTIQSIKDKYL